MVSIIVGIDPNYLIGSKGALPWHIKEDLQHFKNYTLGKKLLMGLTTFKSIGKPLKDRINIVACNDQVFKADGVTICEDATKLLEEYKDNEEELVIIGGASIYRLALPYAKKLVISHIKKAYEGDTYFPRFENEFIEESSEEHEEFVVRVYKRK